MKGTTTGGATGSTESRNGTRRAMWPRALALAAAMSAASCACANPRKQSGWDGPPPKSAAAPQDKASSTSSKLRRPDLPPGWNWNGQAIPTGDPETSVVKLERFAPATVGVGADYEYKVRVTNISRDVSLEDVNVRDRLPGESFTFASAEPAGERSGDQIAWKIGRLAPGESRDIVVRGKAAKPGPMGGFASVSYAPQVGVETMVVGGAPDIALEVAGDAGTVKIDGSATYTITVTNNGAGAGSDLVVDCALENGVEYVSAGGATAAKRDGSKVTFAPLAALAPKASATWNVKVRGAKEGEATFRVSVAAKETERRVEKSVATKVAK